MVTILTVNGKPEGESETWREAIKKGITLFKGKSFRIKEGTRKSEVISEDDIKDFKRFDKLEAALQKNPIVFKGQL